MKRELPYPSESPRDAFLGPEPMRHLSARLAFGPDRHVSDGDIEKALGGDAIEAFRYAQASLAGAVRKTTREPVFCHSADIALRAADLGYGPHTLQVCLLHDSIEDRAHTIAEVEALLTEVEARFGSDVARDTRLLTNRYALIFEQIADQVPKNLPIGPESLGPVKAAIEQLRHNLPTSVARAVESELDRVLHLFLPHVHFADGARKARLDRSYTLVAELRLQSYWLFVEEMSRWALRDGSRFYETPLIVKCLDMVDNLRTVEVVSWRALERVLVKGEILLDTTFYLHEHIHRNHWPAVTFIAMYEYVKHHLVEQLAARRMALDYLADTRFAMLANYLVDEISRLQSKYRVAKQPSERLSAARAEIRQLNGVSD